MKYYTFNPQFHAAVLARVKISTIRSHAKVKPGERFALRHWTGVPYRSKMDWLGSAVCTRVRPIRLESDWVLHIDLDGERLELEGLYRIAASEGFGSPMHMGRWFIDNHKIDEKPLLGVLTEWDPSTFIAGEAKL